MWFGADTTTGIEWRAVGAWIPLLVASLVALGCSETPDGPSDASDGDSAEPTIDASIPPRAEFIFRTSGHDQIEVSGRGTGRTQRNGRTRLNFTATTDDGENFSLLVSVPLTEGSTGETKTVRTAQLTDGGTRYRTDQLTVTLDTYSNGRISGDLTGEFEERQSDGSYESISPELVVSGRFDFTY